jgi:hypothetical protein
MKLGFLLNQILLELSACIMMIFNFFTYFCRFLKHILLGSYSNRKRSNCLLLSLSPLYKYSRLFLKYYRVCESIKGPSKSHTRLHPPIGRHQLQANELRAIR